MNNKSKNSKQKKKFELSRRGVIFVALIAVAVLVINLITASYSWFTPTTDTKAGLDYSSADPIKTRSEDCETPLTYVGTKATAAVAEGNGYSKFKNQIDYAVNASGSVTLTAGVTTYLKTEVINTNTNYGSDISLYIKDLPVCTIAVTYPSNSVRQITSTDEGKDYYIIRNAYVKKYVSTDVNGPGLLEVEWFITPSTGGTLNLNNIYVMYN